MMNSCEIVRLVLFNLLRSTRKVCVALGQVRGHLEGGGVRGSSAEARAAVAAVEAQAVDETVRKDCCAFLSSASTKPQSTFNVSMPRIHFSVE